MSVAEHPKEYHRSARRPKKGDEVLAKRVAYFLGFLCAVMHLLQYTDLWTLLILACVELIAVGEACFQNEHDFVYLPIDFHQDKPRVHVRQLHQC